MASPDIAALYAAQQQLTADPKSVDQYNVLLAGTASSDAKVKQLSATLIPQYMKNFDTQQQEKALHAIIDLCEDEQLQIRVMAIRALASICKSCPDYVEKVAFVLSQLLGADEAVENRAVREAYLGLVEQKLQPSIAPLLQHLPEAEEANRTAIYAFLNEILHKIGAQKIKGDLELQKYITSEVLKIVASLSDDEFIELLTYIRSLPANGKITDDSSNKLLASAVEAHVDLEGDDELADKLGKCRSVTKLIFGQYLNKKASPEKFVKFILSSIDEYDHLTAESKLDLLRLLGDYSQFMDAEAGVVLPKLIATFQASVPDNLEATTDIDYSLVEAALYASHQLGKLNNAAFTKATGIQLKFTGQPADMEDVDEVKAKDIQKRVLALNARVAAYVKESANKKRESVDDDSAAVLRAAQNSITLAKKLIEKQFVGREAVQVSWIKAKARKQQQQVKKQRQQPQQQQQSKQQQGQQQGKFRRLHRNQQQAQASRGGFKKGPRRGGEPASFLKR